MVSPEEAALTGLLNALLGNKLSSVEITHKVEMKTGKQYTEWNIKAKHEDTDFANQAAQKVNDDLQKKYGGV